MTRYPALAILLLAIAPTAVAQTAADSAVAATADAFTDAIVRHDSLAAARILAPDAWILEGGAVETREEYLAHHFHSDSQFLGSMERSPLSRDIRTAGDVAWITSASSLAGTWRDRAVDLVSVETLVLVRGPEGWKITAVHWSSGSAPQ